MMYVSYDHSAHRFLHKHADFHVLCDLDYLAGKGGDTSVFPLMHRDALRHVPEDQLKKLYLATCTQPNPVGLFGTALQNACMALADAMQPTACDAASVTARADALGGGSGRRAPRVASAAAAVATPGNRVDRATIFEVADHMWSQHGQPKTVEALLVLRRSIMDVLERDHKCKRTTASTALGEWQKGKLI